MNIGTKTALGIVTYDRGDFYDKIIDTLPKDSVDKIYVYDSSPSDKKYAKTNDRVKVISGDEPATVGVAKNRLWAAMIEDGASHLYLQEDDVRITNGSVFEAYLETAKQSGLWGSLSYAWHGSANKNQKLERIVKNSIDYEHGVGVDFTKNCAGAFTYHHANIIDKIGYIDEFYKNAWEHLDHYQQVAEKKLASHWWWFTDAKDSFKYFEELDNDQLDRSVIRSDVSWKGDMIEGAKHFRKRFGNAPSDMPYVSEEVAMERMQYLQEKYSV